MLKFFAILGLGYAKYGKRIFPLEGAYLKHNGFLRVRVFVCMFSLAFVIV